MPTEYGSPAMSPWEEEGRRQASALDDLGFVLMIGDDPTAAAEVALAMGRVQARRRRVVIADAVGSLDPIDDLVPFDSPHGIADVFVRGMPIDQVVHAVDAPKNLNVLPSGPAALDRAELMANERWMLLTGEFREAGALLIVVVPTDEPAVEFLLPQVDGVVLVGRAQPVVGARALAYVRGPSGSTALPSPRLSASVSGEGPSLPKARGFPAIPAGSGAVRRPSEESTARVARPKRGRWWLIALVLAGFAAEGAWWWRHSGPGRRPAMEAAAPVDADSTGAGDSSTAADSVTPANAAPATPGSAAWTAADSNAHAAAYALQLDSVTSTTSANALIDEERMRDLPAITYAPVTEANGDRLVRILAAAFRDRRAADSLLGALRSRGVVGPGVGTVVRVPFAVLVQSGVTRDEASFYETGYRSKGLPVYALLQDDGSLRLYAGAFERAADAALLVGAFHANGESPSVTYRIGRLP